MAMPILRRNVSAFLGWIKLHCAVMSWPSTDYETSGISHALSYHHYLVPAVMLTAVYRLRRSGGGLRAALKEAGKSRAPGSSLGRGALVTGIGDCGAAVGLGILRAFWQAPHRTGGNLGHDQPDYSRQPGWRLRNRWSALLQAQLLGINSMRCPLKETLEYKARGPRRWAQPSAPWMRTAKARLPFSGRGMEMKIPIHRPSGSAWSLRMNACECKKEPVLTRSKSCDHWQKGNRRARGGSGGELGGEGEIEKQSIVALVPGLRHSQWDLCGGRTKVLRVDTHPWVILKVRYKMEQRKPNCWWTGWGWWCGGHAEAGSRLLFL